MRLLHAELDQRNNELETALSDLKEMQSQLVEVAHRAGMTEIATGVLHNVGNVLNSVNVSVDVLNESVRRSKVASVAKVAALMNEHAAAFQPAACDPKLQKLPEYLAHAGGVAGRGAATGDDGELQNLTEKVQHIKNIITAQHNYTRRVSFPRRGRSARHARRSAGDARAVDGQARAFRSSASCCPLPTIVVEKSKLLQVLDNLIKNALESMASVERPAHVLTVAAKRRGR